MSMIILKVINQLFCVLFLSVCKIKKTKYSWDFWIVPKFLVSDEKEFNAPYVSLYTKILSSKDWLDSPTCSQDFDYVCQVNVTFDVMRVWCNIT